MDKLKLFLLMIVISAGSMIFGAFIMQADDYTSQNFTMNNRYALLAGPVLVSSQMNTDQATADAVFKIDALTGEVWILHLTIFSPQDPRIISAKFVPTSRISTD